MGGGPASLAPYLGLPWGLPSEFALFLMKYNAVHNIKYDICCLSPFPLCHLLLFLWLITSFPVCLLHFAFCPLPLTLCLLLFASCSLTQTVCPLPLTLCLSPFASCPSPLPLALCLIPFAYSPLILALYFLPSAPFPLLLVF